MSNRQKPTSRPSFRSQAVHNTLALPCVAESAWQLDDESCLPWLQSHWLAHQPMKIVGAGSNLILPPILTGPTILMALKGITVIEETTHDMLVNVAAGESWHDWVQQSLKAGWFGLENLALIPGTVGASPVQNIGAYGVEVGQLIEHVNVWDFSCGQTKALTTDDCQFSYRDSLFKKPEGQALLILSVSFRLRKKAAWQPTLDYPDLKPLSQAALLDGFVVSPQAVFDQVVAVRRLKLPDPASIPNAGSFFKNPLVSAEHCDRLRQRYPGLVAYPQTDGRAKLAAGWMIEQCGWKGRQLGDVGVHERQALVLVNLGNAQARDLLALAEVIGADVLERFGVALEIEPICWA